MHAYKFVCMYEKRSQCIGPFDLMFEGFKDVPQFMFVCKLAAKANFPILHILAHASCSDTAF